MSERDNIRKTTRIRIPLIILKLIISLRKNCSSMRNRLLIVKEYESTMRKRLNPNSCNITGSEKKFISYRLFFFFFLMWLDSVT